MSGHGPRTVVIQAPPRHGKSEYTSKYTPAWHCRTFPNDRVILTSYEANFARGWGQKARNLIREHSRELGVSIDKTKTAANDWSLKGYEGGMSTAGAGGSLTGRGARLFIIDDSIKNAEEALSPTIRDAQWDWYQTTAATRLEPGGLMVVMQTRWHEEDLPGKILHAAKMGEGPPVKLLNLPALAEEGDWLGRAPGEPLWPERWPLETMEARRLAMDQYWFGALYQQMPGRHGSTEWPADYWDEHIWVKALPSDMDFGATGLDPSKGKDSRKGDYSAHVFTGVKDGLLWVDSTIRRRPSEQIVSDGIDFAIKHQNNLHGFGVEVNQFQELLVGEFERQIEERKLPPLPIFTIENRVNKKLRISRLGPYFARRKVRLLDTPDNRLLVEQLKAFSMKDVPGVHDDGPDAMEMAIRTIIETQGGEVRDDGLGSCLVS